MFRMSDVIGLPVIKAGSEKSLGNIKTLLLNKESNNIVAIACRRSILRDYIEVINYSDIQKIDMNYIMIKTSQKFQRIKCFSTHDEYCEYENRIDNLILNDHGDIMGMITDIYFDEKNGYITAYEITEGYIDDIISGRKIINPHNEHLLMPNYQYKQHIENVNASEH